MDDIYTSLNELPATLNAQNLASVFHISLANAYCLMHRRDFPTLHIGRRLVVPKYKLLEWIDRNSGN